MIVLILIPINSWFQLKINKCIDEINDIVNKQSYNYFMHIVKGIIIIEVQVMEHKWFV